MKGVFFCVLFRPRPLSPSLPQEIPSPSSFATHSMTMYEDHEEAEAKVGLTLSVLLTKYPRTASNVILSHKVRFRKEEEEGGKLFCASNFTSDC